MRTISNIQQVKMQLQFKQAFKDELNALMEHYTVEDSIFVYEHGLKEKCNGYFVPVASLESLEEAMDAYLPGYGIRILNNKQFQVGEIHKYLTECSDAETVFDIESFSVC